MNDALEVGLIGVGGVVLGALITAFAQPLWANFVGKHSKLQVEINHFRFRLPAYLRNQIREYIYSYRTDFRPSEEARVQLNQIVSCDGLSEISIRNRSKRSIDGLVLHLENNHDVVADVTIDGEKMPSTFGKVCRVGTLRAGGSCRIALWTSFDNTDRWYDFRKTVVISADEYDKISIKFPAPTYISRNYFVLSRRSFWWAFWVVLILLNIFNFTRLLISHF